MSSGSGLNYRTESRIMSVWKIGSRWSKDGSWSSSILDIFWKHGVVFVGGDNASLFLHAKKEDLVAIADGYSIVGVGKIIDSPKPISNLKLNLSARDRKRVNTSANGIFACRVALREIPEENRPWYQHRKKICCIKQKSLTDEIQFLWNKLSSRNPSKFKIKAQDKTLNDFLEQPNVEKFVTQYFIPIYQRPYAWGAVEIEKFLRDILESYFHKEPEPLFIGTIQLSKKEIISPRGKGVYMQEIIDGQQRITTIALVLKILSLLSDNEHLKKIVRDFEWLETRVNNGEQQSLMEQVFDAKFLNGSLSKEPNRYFENTQLIYSLLKEAMSQNPEEEDCLEGVNFHISSFLQHLLNNLIFVVIETHAGLTKTLQIFNAINTAGLDLNGGDLFKIRMYEYLRDIHGESDDSFNKISSVYAKIDKGNKDAGRFVTDISKILGIYRHIIIAKKKLPHRLIRIGVDGFYDKLFDARFKINKWDNFARVYNNEDEIDSRENPLLSLVEISNLIDIRYRWERTWSDQKALTLDLETRAVIELIWGSRYNLYWLLIFVFEFRFGDNDNFTQLHKKFIVQLGKLFVVYSALFGKAVNEMHTFLAELSRGMFIEDFAELTIEKITTKLNQKRDAFENSLSWEISGNMRVKYLLCRLSALLHADFVSSRDLNLLKIVFHSDLDIEHIKPYHDKNNNIRQDVWNEWGSEINAIGNLMILERHLNRSIRNNDFSKKYHSYKKYSKFEVVQDLLNRVLLKKEGWNKGDAVARRKDETKIIMNYIFND